MKSFRKLGVAAVALAVGMFSASLSHAQLQFPADDPYTSFTQPANALVMPFDAKLDTSVSFFLVSNLSGISPTGTQGVFIPAVSTHWAFWSENCAHLADVYICLTLNDTVVIDPRNLRSQGAGHVEYGPDIDLSGNRGFVVVTSYATGETCADASFQAFLPIDAAIVGSYTFADITSGAAYGSDAIGLGLNFYETLVPERVVNPRCPIDPLERFFLNLNDPANFDCHTELPAVVTNQIDVQTFNPESLEADGLSVVALLALQEQAGSGADVEEIEIGPRTGTISSTATFYDNIEVGTSLPDVGIKCAVFGSLIPGGTGELTALIPDSVSDLTSGLFRLASFSPTIGAQQVSPTAATRTGRWIYAVYGQSLGQFGAGANGKYTAANLKLTGQ